MRKDPTDHQELQGQLVVLVLRGLLDLLDLLEAMEHLVIQELKDRKVEQEGQVHPALREIPDSQGLLDLSALLDNQERREHLEVPAQSECLVWLVQTETLVPVDRPVPTELRELLVMPDLSVIPAHQVELDPSVR